MATKNTQKPGKSIEQITHTEAKRKNIPTVEHQSVMQQHEQAPVPSAVEDERQLVSRAAAWCGARPFGEFERGHAEAALPSAKASRPP